MKIAIFTDTYHPQINGVVSYVSNSLRLLSKNNEIILFAPGDKTLKIDKISPNFKIYWIPAVPFPFYEGYRISSVDYKGVSKLLQKEKPDIVHAHAPVVLGLQGMIAAKRRRIPVVVTYHTHFPDYIPHLLSGKLPKPFTKISSYTVEKMIKHAFKLANVVSAPTQELVKELKSYGVSNVVHIPNGVEIEKFKKDKKKEERFRKHYKIPKNKKVILYLGRISFEKKIDVLLQAFKMIEKPDRFFVIAGHGPYLDNFKKLAKALEIKNIVFTGYMKDEDMVGAYCSADIFASASDTETFGLTFVEAMATGLPIVGVRRLGAKELIKNGKTGILVKPGDAPALAEAMEKLLEKPKLRQRLGKEAYKSAKKYSLENSIKETLKLYKKLTKGE